MSKPMVCPYCHSTAIDFGVSGGAATCMECSRVIEETVIINNVEFVENNGGSSNVVGQFVNETGSFASSTGSRYSLKESREITINNGKRKISQYAAALNLQNYVEQAHKIFVLAVQHGFTQGRRASHVCATCLYVICRWENSPVMLIDFADFLQTNIWALGAVFMKLNTLLHLGVKPIDPSLYLHRFASQMEFGDQTNNVTITALRLTKRMQRDWIVRGRRPLGIIAASLLLAARMHGFKRSKQEILSIVKVCDQTLRNRLTEFSNTAAGSLTFEEFNALAYQTNDFDIDNDGNYIGDDGIIASYPPSYIKNRLKDQDLVKPIADIQKEEGITEEEALLKMGIITPGSHYQLQSKTKSVGKVKKNAEEQYNSIYDHLENEMLNIMESMNVTKDGELPHQNDDSSAKNSSSSLSNPENAIHSDSNIINSSSSLPITSQDIPIPSVNNPVLHHENSNTVSESHISSNSLLPSSGSLFSSQGFFPPSLSSLNSQDSLGISIESSSGLSSTLDKDIPIPTNTTTTTSNNNNNNNKQTLVRIYSGKRMKLDKEITLPNGGIKQVWTPIDEEAASESDSEIDSMFLDEEEQKKKSDIWEAENREWLDEKERKRKEKEQNQPVTHRRQKRQMSTIYRHPVKTAEEGIKKLIEAKKISNKVNYAAVKGLFD